MRHAGGPGAPTPTESVASPGRRRHLHSRRPRLQLLRAAATMALFAAAVPQLPAQETGAGSEAAALLVSGPARRQRLPFLPPNTIEYQRGVYELTEARGSTAPGSAEPGATAPAPRPRASTAPAGGATVEVFYTEAPVFRRGTWTETSCDGRTVHVLPEAGGTTVHYAWPQEQRHAFFRFGAAADASGTPPGGDGAPGDEAAAGDSTAPGSAAAEVVRSQCDFIEAFLDTFSFFLDTTDASGAAPFPAVLPR